MKSTNVMRTDWVLWLARTYQLLEGEIEFWLSVWQFRYRTAKPPCSSSLLCECNRRSCPYRQTSPVVMWRRFREYERDVEAARLLAVGLLANE